MNPSRKKQPLGERVYSMLLYLYPSHFRRTFGEEMKNAFLDMRRDSIEQSGRWGVLKLWPSLSIDLLASAFVQHVQYEFRRMNMFRAKVAHCWCLFERMNFCLQFAVVLAIAALATPPDPVTQLVTAIPLYGVYRFVVRPFSCGSKELAEKRD